MTRWLLALALVGCVPGGDAPAVHTLWLAPGELGHEEQARWGLPLPQGFRVEVLEPGEFFAECDRLSSEPCAPSVAGWTQLPARVALRADLAPEVASLTLVHELGHVLRRGRGHLHCGDGAEQAVMCDSGNPQVSPSWPTARDFDFVLRGADFTLAR